MREKEIEKMLVNAVKIHGGLALKFVSPNFSVTSEHKTGIKVYTSVLS